MEPSVVVEYIEIMLQLISKMSIKRFLQQHVRILESPKMAGGWEPTLAMVAL